jgi:acid stress-induced BolA-like protein IbaG/YrbA
MKITNKFNVPETLLALASRDFYSKGKSDFSVTEIISPPRIQRLRRKHWDEIEQDVSEMLWMLLGTALHVVAERSEVAGHTNEERLTVGIDDIMLSGAIDLQKEDEDGITITDYKFTSAWALMNDKPEWEQQQNIYKYLVERVKRKPVKALKICAFIRDWSRREAMVKESYPQATIQVIDIPMWSTEKVETYIKERVELHRQSKVQDDWNEELTACTEEEKWVRETKYAVKKEGRKTAIRLVDTEEEAKELLATLPPTAKGFIEIRKGEAIRCTGNYCGVSKWCSQYQSTLKESEDEGV